MDSSFDNTDGYLTGGSGNISYLSGASSTHQLLGSSKESLQHRSPHGGHVNITNWSMDPNDSPVSPHTNSSTEEMHIMTHSRNQQCENKPQGDVLDWTYYTDSFQSSMSERVFAITGSSSGSSRKPIVSTSYDSSTDFPEISKLSLSPLDPVKLWNSTMQESYHVCPLSDTSDVHSVNRPIQRRNVIHPRVINSNLPLEISDAKTPCGPTNGNICHSVQATDSSRSTGDSGYSKAISSNRTGSGEFADVSSSDNTSSFLYTQDGSYLADKVMASRYSLSLPLLDQIQSTCRRKNSDSITFNTDTTNRSALHGELTSDTSKPGSTRSTLPGLSYLLDNSDLSTFCADNSENIESQMADAVVDSGNTDTLPSSPEPQVLRDGNCNSPQRTYLTPIKVLEELPESPYKFRTNANKENPIRKPLVNSIRKPLGALNTSNLDELKESPYKFRFKSIEREIMGKAQGNTHENGSVDKENNPHVHYSRSKRNKRLSKRRLSSPTLERRQQMFTKSTDGSFAMGKVSRVKSAKRNSRHMGDSGYTSKIHYSTVNSTPKDGHSSMESETASSANCSSSSQYTSTDGSDIIIDHSQLVTPFRDNRSGGYVKKGNMGNTPLFSPIVTDSANAGKHGIKFTSSSTPVMNLQHNLETYEDFEPLSLLDEVPTLNV